ncbi:MAG TPA: N-acetyltransferase [Burkholderiales bacterium]|nr:N-acetyltransferase [Burkholderiales bacterium]
MVSIRPERPADIPAIREINEAAFGQHAEADLVDALRAAGKLTLSLVAVEGQETLGYVMFSPAIIETVRGHLPVLGLAPLAVTPTLQRRGIGSQLMQAGIDECRKLGHERVVVVGHPEFYRRFNFVRANKYGLRCEYDVPVENFMALELKSGSFANCAGLVKYAPEFKAVA